MTIFVRLDGVNTARQAYVYYKPNLVDVDRSKAIESKTQLKIIN